MVLHFFLTPAHCAHLCHLQVCLFGTSELSLRDAIRIGRLKDDELAAVLRSAVWSKSAALGGHGDMYGIADSSVHNRPMILIGG